MIVLPDWLVNLLLRIYSLFTTPLIQMGQTEISVSSILQFVISLIIVIVLSRWVKHFLKRQLLVKLGISDGNREAIATIVSYSLGTIAFVIVLQTTGFNLASLAVIAGGLGVGIGIGLQDVTKDFVSGLNLLMEQKLKVGDFVEVGDGLSGFIEEISLLSSVVRTLDGGHVIVPNYQFSENQVLNWSYDTYRCRIKVPVGVAYGSDPVLVTECLLKAAYMNPSVQHHPKPEVLLRQFGESSLDFELWVWIDRVDREPQIKSALNFIIEYNLRQQQITIPFPQRDLWLRNPEALWPKEARSDQSSLTRSQPPTESSIIPPSPPPIPRKHPSIRELLPQVTYFKNLNEIELRQLIEAGFHRRLGESEILFHEGDPGNAFYIILSGSVEIVAEKLNRQLKILEAGSFFGELSLMLGIPRTAMVRALEDTILFEIDNHGFGKLLHQHPEFAEVIVKVLGENQEEVAERQKQLRDLGLVDADEDDKNPVNWLRKRLARLFSS